MTPRRSLLLLCLAAMTPACSPDAAPTGAPADLQRGGYIVYLRHAETATTPEPAVRDLADCAWQRNLNAQGRAQAGAIGARFRALDIPVTTLESSPFCRAVQTAELAFGRKPTIDSGLFYHVSQSPAQIAAGVAWLKERLSRPPASGNTVLVGHAPPFKGVTGIELAEGQGAIAKPNGAGSFRVVALISGNGISPRP
ncbi:MAG: histidine phosphatase family protein [Reyranella sp.]|nr:histidine phosphatase family protein [Reyranella sp.]